MAKSSSRLLFVASAALFFGGCTQLDNAIASVPYLAMMRESPFFDPYENPMPAPPGSIPYESPAGVHMPPTEPTEEGLTAFANGPYGKDPFAHDDTTALALGQKMFERHCAVCHGPDAKGHGSVVGPDKFNGSPPDLTATGRAPGYIYAIIRTGRGMMPSYGARVNHTERWAIATYVAKLQAEAGHPVAAGAAAMTTGAAATTSAASTTGAPATTGAAANGTTGGTAKPAATTTAGQENR